MTSQADPVPLLRIRSVPAGHDYVRHAVGPAVDLLPDPLLDPADPDRWWPHPVLEAAERPEVLDDADLVHVHFGYEHRTPQQIARFVDAVHERGLPLVVTVHDLTNPHEPDPAAHLERTGHLVRGADAVITLTAGAAAEIHARWGVRAHVIPHPRLLPRELTDRLRRRRATAASPPTVGVVLGSLRAGIGVEELLPPLVAALPGGARLLVMVRADALAAARDPAHPRHAAALAVDQLVDREAERVEVRVHDLLSDEELCATLAALDALVLPHRHGTHSGWLELCRDLGVPPVIPEIGHLVQQWGSVAATYDPSALDPSSPDPSSTTTRLADALGTALAGPPVPSRAPGAEDESVAAAHLAIYEAVSRRRTISPIHSGANGDVQPRGVG